MDIELVAIKCFGGDELAYSSFFTDAVLVCDPSYKMKSVLPFVANEIKPRFVASVFTNSNIQNLEHKESTDEYGAKAEGDVRFVSGFPGIPTQGIATACLYGYGSEAYGSDVFMNSVESLLYDGLLVARGALLHLDGSVVSVDGVLAFLNLV